MNYLKTFNCILNEIKTVVFLLNNINHEKKNNINHIMLLKIENKIFNMENVKIKIKGE